MKAIFLDIDGVLNNNDTTERTPEGYIGVEDRFIEKLKKIVDATGAVIILSSDWRDEWHHNGIHGKDMFYLLDKLKKYGLEICDKTPGHVKGKGYTGRGREITEYLKKHSGITEYVILDDNDFFDFYQEETCKGHVVITVKADKKMGYYYEMGLSGENVKEAIKILRNR